MSNTSKRNVRGLDIAYESHGEGAPIVFLHGMTADRRSMMPRYEPLFASTSGWRRIYVDLPGMGLTPGSPDIENLDQYFDVVSAFIEAETSGEKVTLVGTSWGAPTALSYVEKFPDRVAGFALIVPFFDDKSLPATEALVTEPGVFDGEPPELAPALTRVATVHTPAVRDWIKNNLMPAGRIADHAFLQRVVPRPFTIREELRQLRFDKPALVLTGKQDAVCGYLYAREFSEHLPRATYAVLDRAGHALQMEQEGLLHAHVRDWLGRVREGLGGPYSAR
jgi:pimeloyl-ACP methyl ester carboxylesterase